MNLLLWLMPSNNKRSASLTTNSTTWYKGGLLSLISNCRNTTGGYVSLVRGIWIYKFRYGVSIASDIKITTRSGSVATSSVYAGSSGVSRSVALSSGGRTNSDRY